ncbi:MAG: ribonuclease E inhibitor RraB [Candidatus Taylorbacteria bacterium]|nr:ribonuclease E inhibitor RraB [Candidatus Taylorbacteria bacterium]
MSEVLFFFYFPNKNLAEQFFRTLKKEGFTLESMGAFDYDASNHYALRVKKNISSDELIKMDKKLTEAAEQFEGIYDGYER